MFCNRSATNRYATPVMATQRARDITLCHIAARFTKESVVKPHSSSHTALLCGW